jgi:hypothetical protein
MVFLSYLSAVPIVLCFFAILPTAIFLTEIFDVVFLQAGVILFKLIPLFVTHFTSQSLLLDLPWLFVVIL